MENPCKTCPRLPEDKNGPACMACEQRLAYVRHLNAQPWASESMFKKEDRTMTETIPQPETTGDDAPPPSLPSTTSIPHTEKPEKKCTVSGCEEKHLAKGLCCKHYHQQRSKKKTPKKLKPEQPAAPAARKYTIHIDPALHQSLEKLAEKELRTTENQVAYMLIKALELHEAARPYTG